MLTEPKATVAGVTLEASFARFTMSIATFNEEMTPSCFLGCCDSVAMVEMRGGCEETVVNAGCEEEPEPEP